VRGRGREGEKKGGKGGGREREERERKREIEVQCKKKLPEVGGRDSQAEIMRERQTASVWKKERSRSFATENSQFSTLKDLNGTFGNCQCCQSPSKLTRQSTISSLFRPPINTEPIQVRSVR
jgi:hypothetical protein